MARRAQAELKHMNPTPAIAPLAAWVAADEQSLRLLELSRKVARTPSTVLIRGESGTGKELLSQILHLLGANADEPLVKIDCASLPTELLESELFGYERGAFTGAEHTKPGRLELAGEGTLVLDEIAALSLPLQAKLLRVLEERSFERLGGHRSVHIQARLVALTSVDLERAVAQRSFREDLFYRLNVVPLMIPPLRQRPKDIEPLCLHFLAQLCSLHRRLAMQFEPAALEAMQRYEFPGNVRELRNLIERAVIHTDDNVLRLRELALDTGHSSDQEPTPERTLEEIEREYIASVLQRHRGHKTETARVLGISRKTLLEKRRRYKLD